MHDEASQKSTLQVLLESFAAVWRELLTPRRAEEPAVDAAAESLRRYWERRDNERALDEEYSDRMRYNWTLIDERTKAHGVSFSVHATRVERAAILDFLDNPSAPTLLRDRHTFLFEGMGANGRPSHLMSHTVNRAKHRISSREFPTIFPPERNGWTAEQWRNHDSALRGSPQRPAAATIGAPTPSPTRAPERHI